MVYIFSEWARWRGEKTTEVICLIGVHIMRLLRYTPNDRQVRHYEGGTTEVIFLIRVHIMRLLRFTRNDV